MKIEYQIPKKERFRLRNALLGLQKEANKIQKHPYKKEHTALYFMGLNLITIFILIVWGAYFSEIINPEYEEIVLSSFSIAIIALLIYLVVKIIKFITYRTNSEEGVLEINEKGIIQEEKNGKDSFISWQNLKSCFITKRIIAFFSNENSYIVLPFNEELHRKVTKLFKEKKLDDKIINCLKEERAKRTFFEKLQCHFWGWIIYFLLLALPFGLLIGFSVKNMNLLEKQMNQIFENDFKVDEDIYTRGNYSIIEKELKSYYKELKQWRTQYEKNAAMTTFNNMTLDVLSDIDQIETISKDLENRKEKTDEAINHLIRLMDETVIMNRIDKHDLLNTERELYREYAISESDEKTKVKWQNELEENNQNHECVKRMLEILLDPENIWYIDGEDFYMDNEELRLEYNALFHMVSDENKM